MVFKHSKYRLFFLICLVSLTYAFFPWGSRYNMMISILFSAIGILSAYGVLMVNDLNKISVNNTFSLFYYTFFFLAPIEQFKRNTTFFTDQKLEDIVYIKSGLLILLSSLLYLFLYQLFKKSVKLMPSANSRILNIDRAFSLKSLYFISIVSVISYMILIKLNIRLVFFRPFVFSMKDNALFGNMGYGLLLVIRQMPFIVFLFYRLKIEKNDKHVFAFLFL